MINSITLESDFDRKVPLKFRVGEWTLGTWSPRMRVLVPQGFPKNDWPPIAEAVSSAVDDNLDGVLFRKVSITSVAPGIARFGSFIGYVPFREVLHCVALQGTFADYLKSFSGKSRQNLVRAVRRFSERQQPSAAWEVLTAPEDMPRFQSEAAEISRQTYQTRLLGAGLPPCTKFTEELVELAKRGMARGYLLRDRGKAIAFAWCREQDRRLIYDIVGYLPDYAAHSPGTVLLYHVLEDAFSQKRFDIVDFGPGEAQYKAMFANQHLEYVDLYLFKPTIQRRLMVTLHWQLVNRVGELGQWLEQHGWKRSVRDFMRRLHR